MKINILDLRKLRNEEHFQFQSEFTGLVDKYTPAALNVEGIYPAYQSAIARETDTLNLIRKSQLTDELSTADNGRDTILDGMFEAVSAAGKHYDPVVRQASVQVQFVLNQYDGISKKSYNEETAAIKSLLKEIHEKCAADATTLAIDGWLGELERNNTAFEELMKNRYTEAATKPQYRMKEVRLEVDEAYRRLLERINALIVVNGPADYEAFVNELNERVLKYKLILAQRKGRNSREEEEEAQ